MSTTAMTMPAGRNKCASGVSTDATAGGTSLSIRNRLRSQPVAPALSKIADVPNSTAPRPARSPAARAPGTRAGRFGHHHEAMAGHRNAERHGRRRPWPGIDDLPGGCGQAGPMNLAGLTDLVNRVIAWADRLQRKHG